MKAKTRAHTYGACALEPIRMVMEGALFSGAGPCPHNGQKGTNVATGSIDTIIALAASDDDDDNNPTDAPHVLAVGETVMVGYHGFDHSAKVMKVHSCGGVRRR
jgi:hypothetical protein